MPEDQETTTDDLASRIVREYVDDDRVTTYSLAERHELPVYRVRELLLAARVPLRGKTGQVASPEMIKAYEAGASIRDVAAAAGISYSTARYRLQSSGIPLRTQSEQLKRSTPACPPGMVEMYKRASIKQVGAEFGYGEILTRRMLLAAGVTLRPQGAPVWWRADANDESGRQR